MELEIGGKYLDFGELSFLSGDMGITLYTGDFYINIRGGMGPKIQDQLVQNYQRAVRYYLQSDENYLYAHICTGISSDEATQFTQIVNNPNLKTYYALAGLSKWFGNLNLGLSTGYQYQELSKDRIGHQIL